MVARGCANYTGTAGEDCQESAAFGAAIGEGGENAAPGILALFKAFGKGIAYLLVIGGAVTLLLALAYAFVGVVRNTMGRGFGSPRRA